MPTLSSKQGLRALAIAVLSLAASPLAAQTAEQPFLDQNAAAMDRMMSAMAVTPTGDVDRDFVEMMVPHHQGGIDMALAVLRYGKNEQLRRLAQEIIVEQQQEIAAMRLAMGDALPPSSPAPTQSPTAASPPPAASQGSPHDALAHHPVHAPET